MLLKVIEDNTTQYSVGDIARMLADSEANLGDPDACLDVLIQHSVRPWQFGGSFLEARIEANNLRALSYWSRKGNSSLTTLPVPAGTVAAVLVE